MSVALSRKAPALLHDFSSGVPATLPFSRRASEKLLWPGVFRKRSEIKAIYCVQQANYFKVKMLRIEEFSSLSLLAKLSIVFNRKLTDDDSDASALQQIQSVRSLQSLTSTKRLRKTEDSDDAPSVTETEETTDMSTVPSASSFSAPRGKGGATMDVSTPLQPAEQRPVEPRHGKHPLVDDEAIEYYNVISQPKCLLGGMLKSYQMESLQWLVNMHLIANAFRAHFLDASLLGTLHNSFHADYFSDKPGQAAAGPAPSSPEESSSDGDVRSADQPSESSDASTSSSLSGGTDASSDRGDESQESQGSQESRLSEASKDQRGPGGQRGQGGARGGARGRGLGGARREALRLANDTSVNVILADEMGLGKTIQTIAILALLSETFGITGPHLVIVPKSTIPQWQGEFAKWLPAFRVVTLIGERADRDATIAAHLSPGLFSPAATGKGASAPAAAPRASDAPGAKASARPRLPFNVLLTTYDVVKIEKGCLSRVIWRYMVLDEGHKLKNNDSQISGILRDYVALHKLILSGTPLQNNLHELWSLLNFLMPAIFDSAEEFTSLLSGGLRADATPAPAPTSPAAAAAAAATATATATATPTDPSSSAADTAGGASTGDSQAPGQAPDPPAGPDDAAAVAARRIHEVLKFFILRREKKDVENLPPKYEYLLHCPMTSLQRELYKSILSRDLTSITKILNSKSESSSFGRASLANILMQLRKCSDHPYLFDGVEPEPFRDGEHIVNVSGKMVMLEKLVRRIHAQGEKLLVFCQMTHLMNIIEDYLRLREYRYCRIDGATDLVTRARYMEEFNATDDGGSAAAGPPGPPGAPASGGGRPRPFIFLLSTRAGCLGLNLTAANHVIIYQQDFNPQADLQAVARSYRLLQRRPVFVYRLLSENTVDVRIYERSQVKLEIDNIIIQNGNFSNALGVIAQGAPGGTGGSGGPDRAGGAARERRGGAELDDGGKISRKQLMDMIAISADALFDDKGPRRDLRDICYDEPEIVIPDERLEAILREGLARQDALQESVRRTASTAEDVISKLASDGKLEQFSTDDLYRFEGQDFARQNMRRFQDRVAREQQLQRIDSMLARHAFASDAERDAAREAVLAGDADALATYSLGDLGGLGGSLGAGVPGGARGGGPDRPLEKRVYPTVRRLKLNSYLYKLDIQLYPVRYYALIDKILHEITTVVEPAMAASATLDYADLAAERGYANPQQPGLTQAEVDELETLLQNRPAYFSNGDVEVTKKEFTLLIAAMCDYEPESYGELTGVRRVLYDVDAAGVPGASGVSGGVPRPYNSARADLCLTAASGVLVRGADHRGNPVRDGRDGGDGRPLVKQEEADSTGASGSGSGSGSGSAGTGTGAGVSAGAGDGPQRGLISADDVAGRENWDCVYMNFVERMRYARENPERFTRQDVECYGRAVLEKWAQLEEGKKIIARVERACARRAAYFRKVTTIRTWVDRFDAPMYNMIVPSMTTAKRYFTNFEDRFLLLETDICGYGCWDEVLANIRASPLFTFDWWFKTRTPEEIGKRVDKLQKCIELELDLGTDPRSEGSDEQSPEVSEAVAEPAAKRGRRKAVKK